MAGNCIMFLLLKMISKTHLSIPYCRSFPIHEHLGRERGEIEGRVPLWEKSTEAQCLFKTKFLVAVVVVMAAATAALFARGGYHHYQCNHLRRRRRRRNCRSGNLSRRYRSYVKPSNLLEPSFQATPATASCGFPPKLRKVGASYNK